MYILSVQTCLLCASMFVTYSPNEHAHSTMDQLLHILKSLSVACTKADQSQPVRL